MTEDKTKETVDSRPFEERVFARFDGIDERFERVEGRLGSVEIRIGKLEDRQYDTKPIWEQALAAIAATNLQMLAGFEEIRVQLAAMNSRLDRIEARLDGVESRLDRIEARLDTMDARFEAVDARFNKQDTDSENGFGRVERKIDVLNHNILELRADQRYVDSRLERIETQAKPS